MTVVIRASVGRRTASSSPSTGPLAKPNWLSFFSSDRSAFCSASGKLRPIAMASPTDFIVVVRVGSAPGNFSKANRGTFTTT